MPKVLKTIARSTWCCKMCAKKQNILSFFSHFQ